MRRWTLLGLIATLMGAAAWITASLATTYTSLVGLNTSTYVDLGAGPVLIEPLINNIEVVAADSAPSVGVSGHIVTSGTRFAFNTTQHAWARAIANTTNVKVSPITAGGGGGGGGFTATPVAPTVSASNAVTSLVLKASATSGTGGVTRYHAESASATAGYCVLYNATAAPAPGALSAVLVLDFQLLPANGYCDVDHTLQPISASAGAVVLITSAATPFTYTTGTITAAISGVAQ